MAKRKARRNVWGAGELNLTAMIDMAFQLLNFFIIAAHPMDIYTKLSVLRPMADSAATKNADMLTIMVLPKAYMINDRMVDFNQLDIILGKLAAMNNGQTVVIQCINQSPHKQLIKLLDLCSKVGLSNLSVVSSGGA